MSEKFMQRDQASPDTWDLIGAPETSTVALSTVTTLHYADATPDDTLPANTAAVVWGTADITFDRRAYSYLLFTVVGSGTLSAIKHADLSTLTDDYAVLGRVTLGGVLPWQQGAGALDTSGGVTHIPTDCLDFPLHAEICNDTPSELHFTMDDTAGSPAVHKQTVDSYVLPGGHRLQEIVGSGSTPDTSYQAVILADSPLAYWPLGSAPAGVTPDITGHGFDGTVSVPRFVSTGSCPRNGLSCLFTPGDFITCALPGGYPLPLGASWSVEGWVRTVASWCTMTPLAWGMYGTESTANATSLFGWSPICSPGLLPGPQFQVNLGGGLGVGGTYARDGMDDSDTYHYFVVTWDGAGAMQIYWDNVLLSTDTMIPVPPTATYASPDYLAIGAILTDATTVNDDSSDVYYDDIALYSYPLTPTQVAAHYAAGLFCAGGENSLVAKDPSGNLLWKHTGTVFTVYSPAGTAFATFG